MSLAAVIKFPNYFRTDPLIQLGLLALTVMFSCAGFWQQDLKLCGVKFMIFLLRWHLASCGVEAKCVIHQVESSNLWQVCAVKSVLLNQTCTEKPCNTIRGLGWEYENLSCTEKVQQTAFKINIFGHWPVEKKIRFN